MREPSTARRCNVLTSKFCLTRIGAIRGVVRVLDWDQEGLGRLRKEVDATGLYSKNGQATKHAVQCAMGDGGINKSLAVTLAS